MVPRGNGRCRGEAVSSRVARLGVVGVPSQVCPAPRLPRAAGRYSRPLRPGPCPSVHLSLTFPRLLQDLQRRETEVYDCIQSEASSPPSNQDLLSQVRRGWAASLILLRLSCSSSGKWVHRTRGGSHLLPNQSPLCEAAGLVVRRSGGFEPLLHPLPAVQPWPRVSSVPASPRL